MNLRPAVALDLIFVVRATSLKHGLVDTATAGNDTNHGSVGGGDDLLVAGGQLDPGPLGVGVMGNHGCVVTAGPGELATISGLLLEVADNGSLGHVADGHHVSDGDVSLLSAVHELSSVHTLSSDKELLLGLVAVWVTEVSDGKGSTTTGVMDDVFDNSLDVTVPLGEVHGPEGGLALPVLSVRGEDRPSALPLGTDDTTHFSCRSESSNIKL